LGVTKEDNTTYVDDSIDKLEQKLAANNQRNVLKRAVRASIAPRLIMQQQKAGNTFLNF
jgi:hypothetical protein